MDNAVGVFQEAGPAYLFGPTEFILVVCFPISFKFLFLNVSCSVLLIGNHAICSCHCSRDCSIYHIFPFKSDPSSFLSSSFINDNSN